MPPHRVELPTIQTSHKTRTLPNTRIKQQIPPIRQPQTGLQKALQRSPLVIQRIHNFRSRLDKRSLEHIQQNKSPEYKAETRPRMTYDTPYRLLVLPGFVKSVMTVLHIYINCHEIGHK